MFLGYRAFLPEHFRTQQTKLLYVCWNPNISIRINSSFNIERKIDKDERNCFFFGFVSFFVLFHDFEFRRRARKKLSLDFV